jgi:predicted nucleotidyltransferase
MSTAGYREIFAAALEVEVSPGLVVRIASLPGLAVMKVVAGLEEVSRQKSRTRAPG